MKVIKIIKYYIYKRKEYYLKYLLILKFENILNLLYKICKFFKYIYI